MEGQSPLKILLSNKRYVYGVVAQFFNVAAQVCTWTYLIQYSQQALNGSLQLGGYLLQVSLIVFLISRFFMTWLIGKIRATKVLSVLAVLAVVLCVFAMFSPNVAGVAAVVALSFCLSLMFPTIYGVALQGLGPATKFGAAGLVMAIVGGAIMPLIQGCSARRDQPGDLVHRARRLLRRRRQFRRLRPESGAPQGWRTNSMKRYWIIALASSSRHAVAAGRRPTSPTRPTGSKSCRGGCRLRSTRRSRCCSTHSRREIPTWRSIDGTIAGGGGSNVQVALAARLQAGRSARCLADVPGQFAARLGRRRPHRRRVRRLRELGFGSAPCRRHCSTRRPIGSRPGACRPGPIAEMCCGSTSGCCETPA